jgi:7-cyano-7-deazaguanine synthase in queuosine biosynthesis
LLSELLNFLSDDSYSFTFEKLKQDRPAKPDYLEFGAEDWPFHSPERVLMFSGGLDSLTGAVETAKNGKKSVLVSHRPVSTMSARQQKLFQALQKEFPGQLIHVPVWINKNERFGQESTQRTRSFLFAALGTVVAHSINAGGVRFFENGVVSLNFPVADEVLRSRASRTTHPIALNLLQSLCAAVVERDIVIDNPYCYKTRTDVVETLSSLGLPHLIAQTCSCAHSIFKPRTQWHCGTCSQCIDRRFAITAARLEQYDSKDDYVTDVFLGARKNGYEKNMAVDYIRHGLELSQRPESDFAAIFSTELSRAVRHESKRSEAAEKVIAMHKRHGEAVERVLREKVAERSADLVNHTLEPSSLLALAISTDSVKPGELPSRPGTTGELALILDDAQQMKFARQIADRLIEQIGGAAKKPRNKGSKKPPARRDAVIFAAILKALTGLKYCAYLQEHLLRPKWSDSGPASYTKSYEMGGSSQKKVQDEKSRAASRMNRYVDSELANAFITYLPSEFDELSRLLNSRNSRSASTAAASR